MKRLIIVLVLVLLLLPVMACDQQAAGELLMSDKPRDTSPDVSQADLALLIEGNSAFAFDLYQALREEEEKGVISSTLLQHLSGAGDDICWSPRRNCSADGRHA